MSFETEIKQFQSGTLADITLLTNEYCEVGGWEPVGVVNYAYLTLNEGMVSHKEHKVIVLFKREAKSK